MRDCFGSFISICSGSGYRGLNGGVGALYAFQFETILDLEA